MTPDTAVIVNPRSQGGRTARQIAGLERQLAQALGPHRLLFTEGPGDGERLGRMASEQGAARVIVAGGDGTISEVVSGLFRHSESPRVELGLLPLGSGSDLARYLELGRDVPKALAKLARGSRRRVDVGRLSYRAPDGREHVRWFLNIASFGMTGTAMLWLTRQPKRGPLSYVQGGLRALLSYREPVVRVAVDGRELHCGALLLGVVANGQYFGSGMRIAPRAALDDGQLDVLLAAGMSRPEALALFPLVFVGRHLRSPHIRSVRGRRVELSSEQEVWLEADGEALGTLPARIELLPSALTLCGV